MARESNSNLKFALSKKLKLGVLSGGSSSERIISIRSARAVNRALRRIGFTTLVLDPAKAGPFTRGLKTVDLVFIALHGEGGEDGKIQRRLERSGIPYVGSDPVASRRAFDKNLAKKIFSRSGISTPPYVLIRPSNYKNRLRRIPAPLFVKPVREGSSVGAFSVEDLSKSAEKLYSAVRTYGRLLVEKKIQGREFTVGVLGRRPLPVIELKPRRAFYDYRAKYTKGMTDYLVPAPITPVLTRKLQRMALKAHRALGLRDFSRVDIMTDEKGRPYVLEVNSIPGFTELSLLPKAARAAGISFEELCYRLVEAAYRRGLKMKRKGRRP